MNPFLAVFPSEDRGSIFLTSRFLEFIVSLLQGTEDLISQERDARQGAATMRCCRAVLMKKHDWVMPSPTLTRVPPDPRVPRRCCPEPGPAGPVRAGPLWPDPDAPCCVSLGKEAAPQGKTLLGVSSNGSTGTWGFSPVLH